MKKLTGLIMLSVTLLFASSPMVSAQTSPADSQRQSLGVNVEETGQGLTVRSVIIGSAAVGQLELGDVLQFLAADGHPVYATQTLRQMKKAKEAIGLDVPAYLQIQRGGVTRVLDVEFATSGTFVGNGRVASIDDAVFSSTLKGNRGSGAASAGTAVVPQAAPSLNFDRLISAELNEGKDGADIVVLTKQRWAQELMEYVYTETVMQEEARERTKRIAKEVVVDGKTKTVYEDVAETYTVTVPTTVAKTAVKSLLKPVEGAERIEVSVDAVRAWALDGTLLSVAELKARLRGVTRVFVLPSGYSEYSADPFFTAAVSNDALVIAEPPGLGPLPAIMNANVPAVVPEATPAVAAPAADAPAPPAAEAAPPAVEAAPSVAPPAEPELPPTDAPVEGSSLEN